MPKGKRSAEDEIDRDVEKEKDKEISMLEFEDAFEDDYEEEEIVDNDDDDGDEEGDGEDEDEEEEEDDEEEDEDDESEDSDDEPTERMTKDSSSKKKDAPTKVWRPGVDVMLEGEELEFDPRAYHIMQQMKVEWPCLSFSIVEDKLGFRRKKYPHTLTLITGTQAPEKENNSILVVKLSQLGPTEAPDDSDSDDEFFDENADEDDVTYEPVLEMRPIPHMGCINKIKSMPQRTSTVAAWSEEGVVEIYDLRQLVKSLDIPGEVAPTAVSPSYVCSSHKKEGFALDWSPLTVGRLLSGDCDRHIFESLRTEAGYTTIAKPYEGHISSVEDLQWSPNEADVFCSCSADKTVKIWDARANSRKAVISVAAHSSDVNVVAWNKKVPYLLASGSDDTAVKIWDLRNFKKDQAISHFQYHRDQIVSLEWNLIDETQIVVGSADNQVTIWDLSLEADEGEQAGEGGDDEFPHQLFFVHQGQHNVKEVHYHPQIPNVIISTAEDGFNIFKPANT